MIIYLLLFCEQIKALHLEREFVWRVRHTNSRENDEKWQWCTQTICWHCHKIRQTAKDTHNIGIVRTNVVVCVYWCRKVCFSVAELVLWLSIAISLSTVVLKFWKYFPEISSRLLNDVTLAYSPDNSISSLLTKRKKKPHKHFWEPTDNNLYSNDSNVPKPWKMFSIRIHVRNRF